MKAVILNNVFDATITASSENPSNLFSEALINTNLSRRGRTLLDAAQWVKFSFSGAVNVDTVGVLGNNFLSTATVKIQANATDVWTSPSVDQALTYIKDVPASDALGRDVGSWTYQFSSTQSYQYWRLYVDDGSNPDTYIEVGAVFLDMATIFPGMAVNQVFPMYTTSEPQFSTSGQVTGLRRLRYNGASFNFPVITEAEKTTMEAFFYDTDIIKPYLLFVWEDSLDIQRPLYVVNTKVPEFRRVETDGGLMWAFSNEIREVF